MAGEAHGSGILLVKGTSLEPTSGNGLPGQRCGGRFYSAQWRFSDLWYFFLYLALALAANILIPVFPSTLSGTGVRIFFLSFLITLEAAIPLWVLKRRRGTGNRSSIAWKKRVLDFGSGCFTYVMLIPTLMIVAGLLAPFQEETFHDRLGFLRDTSLPFQVVLCTASFTVVPVCEEILFRGFLYNILRTRFRVGAALIMQALLFGILHPYTPTYPIYIAVVGLALGIVYHRRKTLLAPIVTHACFNAVGGILILAVAWADYNPPATTWEEAMDVLEPPSDIVLGILTDGVQETDPKLIEYGLDEILGTDGLRAPRLEAALLCALSRVPGTDRSSRARFLLHAARLYADNGDPRRALLLSWFVTKRFPDVSVMAEEAQDLYTRMVDRMGEAPTIEIFRDDSGNGSDPEVNPTP